MQITIEMGSETVEAELPEVSISFPVAPGGTLYGFLQTFYPENLLSKGVLYDAQACREIREKHKDDWASWAERNYSWNQFCREVNHILQPEAEALAELLLARDLMAEMRCGGLFGGKSQEAFIKATGLEPKTFLVSWMRLANRYAWMERALQHELPDPKFDPIPPIRHAGRQKVETIYKRHVEPYLREVFYAKDHTHTLDVFAQAVLYAFGYLPDKPTSISDELWERAVAGLFGPTHTLSMMCVFPGDYFNYVAQEEQSGRAAFFPTPLEVATLMGEMLLVNKDEPATADERRARLLQEVSDPAVGAGNLAWPLMNDFVRGQFTDINPTMVHATRALFALYAPWFAGSVFCVDALDGHNAEPIQTQARQYAVDAALTYAGFQSYARRKTEALLEAQGAEGALRQYRESQATTGHIQARANARRLSSDTTRFQELFHLLSQSGLKPEPEDSEPHTQPDRPSRPASPKRPKPGLPGQLSFFD